MSWIVVGVDCATQEERTGLAHGIVHDDGKLELKRVTLGTAGESAVATVAGWIKGTARFVVALDAPLGWPHALASSLIEHRAGQAILTAPDEMFRRQTDRFVHAQLRKLPPEVGADRSARTARSALAFLDGMRRASEHALPLAWVPGADSGAIEVYPAATLISRGIASTGYKGDSSGARAARTAIWRRLQTELNTDISVELVVEDDDLLDAAVCALAAADFARDNALSPEDRELAEREGWIWFRGRGQRSLF